VSPLSVQAASLIRSIDALSTIFWISIGGTILTLLFAGLNQLAGNVAADSIYIGVRFQRRSCRLPVSASPRSSSG
jgi:hypothetical protein